MEELKQVPNYHLEIKKTFCTCITILIKHFFKRKIFSFMTYGQFPTESSSNLRFVIRDSRALQIFNALQVNYRKMMVDVTTHSLDTNLNHKKMGTLQFYIPGFQNDPSYTKQKEFLKSNEVTLK